MCHTCTYVVYPVLKEIAYDAGSMRLTWKTRANWPFSLLLLLINTLTSSER